MSRQAAAQEDQMTQARRAWLFQANPNRYHIYESLQAETEEYWNLNQHVDDVRLGDRVVIWICGEHVDDVRLGDRVVIWICGEHAGIYAIGTVVSAPEVRADSATGIGYWVQPAEGRWPKARVRVRYDQVFLNRPLLKAYIACDPALAHLKVLRAPHGTNYEVSDEEWRALTVWLDDAGIAWF